MSIVFEHLLCAVLWEHKDDKLVPDVDTQQWFYTIGKRENRERRVWNYLGSKGRGSNCAV